MSEQKYATLAVHAGQHPDPLTGAVTDEDAIRRLGEGTPITEAEERASSGFALTEDFQGAVQAFKARRKPVWHGR